MHPSLFIFPHHYYELQPTDKKQLPGQILVVANGAYHQYELDLFFISHIASQEYGIALISIYACLHYAIVEPIKGISQDDLSSCMTSAFVHEQAA